MTRAQGRTRPPVPWPLAVALLLAVALPAAAQPASEPAFELTTDVLSRYVWRGYDVSHADPTLVTSLMWSPGQLPGLWLKVDLLGGLRKAPELGDESNNLDEVDVTVGWEKDDLAGGRLTLGGASTTTATPRPGRGMSPTRTTRTSRPTSTSPSGLASTSGRRSSTTGGWTTGYGATTWRPVSRFRSRARAGRRSPS